LLKNQKLHHKWTPAEVSQILFRHTESVEQAIQELIEEDPAKLFKFSQMVKKQESTDLTTLFESVEETDQKKKNTLQQPPQKYF
jgi:hypothetical protein